MIEEKLEDFMQNVDIKCRDVAIYKNEEKGLYYPLALGHLLCRVDYLELTKEELQKAKFEQKIDDIEYEMFDCDRIVPKYEITKNEADKFTLTTKKVKATHIWNVANQTGIHHTFENKKDAFDLCEQINSIVIKELKK